MCVCLLSARGRVSATVGLVWGVPQAYTETGISAGLPIATELRPSLTCDLKTIAMVGSKRLTSLEWVTSGVGSARGASAEADSLGRVISPEEVVSAIFSDIIYRYRHEDID